jgi:hypothetical protein
LSLVETELLPGASGRSTAGWHLDHEPVIKPDASTDEQAWLIQTRADAQAGRDTAEAQGEDVDGWNDELADLDDEINDAGMRGNVLPAEPLARDGRRGQFPYCGPAHRQVGRVSSVGGVTRNVARRATARCLARAAL